MKTLYLSVFNLISVNHHIFSCGVITYSLYKERLLQYPVLLIQLTFLNINLMQQSTHSSIINQRTLVFLAVLERARRRPFTPRGVSPHPIAYPTGADEFFQWSSKGCCTLGSSNNTSKPCYHAIILKLICLNIMFRGS